MLALATATLSAPQHPLLALADAGEKCHGLGCPEGFDVRFLEGECVCRPSGISDADAVRALRGQKSAKGGSERIGNKGVDKGAATASARTKNADALGASPNDDMALSTAPIKSDLKDGLTVFIISGHERMEQQPQVQLSAIGFKNVVMSPPVLTNLTCVDRSAAESEKATGTMMAHRTAWRRVVGAERAAVILESDWSIGEQHSDVVRKTVFDAMAHLNAGYDFAWLGYCEASCDSATAANASTSCGGEGYIDKAPPPLCLTGYMMKPSAARDLLDYDICNIDAKEWEAPGTPPVDWYVNHRCRPEAVKRGGKHALKCFVAPGPDKMEGCYGQGVFQQNMTYAGLHSAEHRQQAGKDDSSTDHQGSSAASTSGSTTARRKESTQRSRLKETSWTAERVAEWYQYSVTQRASREATSAKPL